MSFIAGILTVAVVLNCLLLILLVLIQLPKKDAGAGMAFGGGAADALFGAGSGNALTKITKWATGIFFVMALLLGFMEERLHRSDSGEFEKKVEQQQSQLPIAPPPTMPAPVTAPATNVSGQTTAPSAANLPATTTTNPPAAPTQPK